MTPEIRQAIRLRAMKDCPHWEMGNKLPRPCEDCELGAAIAEEREAIIARSTGLANWEAIAQAIRARP